MTKQDRDQLFGIVDILEDADLGLSAKYLVELALDLLEILHPDKY